MDLVGALGALLACACALTAGRTAALVCTDAASSSLADRALAALGRLAVVAEALLQTWLAAPGQATGHRAIADEPQLQSDRWQRMFQQAERLAQVGSWRLDLHTAAFDWSAQAYAIFGRDASAGAPDLNAVLNFYPREDRGIIMQAIDRAIESGVGYDIETNILTAGGEQRRVRNVAEIERKDGVAVGLIGIYQDITLRFLAEQELGLAARMDELTQIPNRAGLNQFLTRHVEHDRLPDGALAVLLIDLDNFKAANDSCGHGAGDEVLQQIARKLAARGERLGLAARLGGDEFVLAITDPAAVAGLRDLLPGLLEELRVDMATATGVIRVAATIGGCVLGPGIRTKAELLKRADLALYGAKALGKGKALVSGDLRPIVPRSAIPPRSGAADRSDWDWGQAAAA